MAKRLGVMTLSGREFKVKDFKLIKETISLFPALSRQELSKTLCEILEWYQADGEPKYLSCQKVLEKLEAWGHIKLPPLIKQNKGYHHKVVITEKSDPEALIFGQVDEYGPIVIEAINDREQGRLWSEYIQRYHYLGHRNAFGSQQKYFIRFDSEQLLGCILYSASAWAVGCRDKWIGWNKYQRVKNLHLILSQSRFLIFPWIKVKNLASKVLSLSAKQVQKDWLRRYNFRPVMLESFVDRERFTGTDLYHMNGILDLLGYAKSVTRSALSIDLFSPMNDLMVVPDPVIYGIRSFVQLEQRVFNNSMYGMGPYHEFDYLLPPLSANNMFYSSTMPYEAFSPLYR